MARVHADGTKSQLVQEMVRVESPSGADGLSVYRAGYESDQRLTVSHARVHRAGGTTEEAPVGRSPARRATGLARRVSYPVRFPPLQPGDVIEVLYRIDDLRVGFFGDYYGHVAYLQDDAPLDLVRYVLIGPAEREFHFHLVGVPDGGLARREVELSEAGRTYVFEARGVPALENEPRQPWLKELLPQVQVSTFADWDAFARWYWNLVAGQHEADDALRALVAELCEGAADDEERLRRIYEFVVSEVRYNDQWEFGIHGYKPYNATRILARRFGDCKDKATLINTMAREVGITAYPVLIYGETSRGREDLTLPLIRHFNHCISWADLGEGGVFLDGTAEHHPYGTLPTMDYGARVVVISPDGSAVRGIPYRGPEANQVRETHEVRVARDGSATLSTELSASGDFEYLLRRSLLTAAQRPQVIEPRLGRDFPGASVDSVECSDPTQLSQPLRLVIEATLPRITRELPAGEVELRPVRSWMFRDGYLRGDRLSALAADDERTRDVVLPAPVGVEEHVRYQLPAGAVPRRLPPPVRLTGPFGRYERVYELKGQVLEARRVLRLEAVRIPASQYEAFRTFLSEVEAADAALPVIGFEETDR